MATRIPDAIAPSTLRYELEWLRARVAACEERLCDMIDKWGDRPTPLPVGPCQPPVVRPGGPEIRSPGRAAGKASFKWADPKYARMAEPGVARLAVGAPDEQHRPVSINDAAARSLPMKMAAFLETLAAVDHGTVQTVPAGDGFVPWKEKASIARERGCTERAVTVMVGRLRDRLWEDFSVSPLLVETRAGQVRFRLRLPAPGALDNAPPGSTPAADSP